MPSLTHPVRDPGRRTISQRFGERSEYYAQYRVGGAPLRGHNGVDYACPAGSEILACDDGVALEANPDPANDTGYGCYVKLGHPWGESLVAHLAAGSLRVVAGWQVRRGQALGLSGSTGNSSGPHLHFGIRLTPYERADGWGGFRDPQPFIYADTTSPNLITWHFQGGPLGQTSAQVQAARPAWIKRMDPEGPDPFPGSQTLGRVYMRDADANAMVGQGAAGGEAWFRYCLPHYRAAPYVRWWEFANETPVNDLEYNRRLAGAIVRWAELMHQEGLFAVGPVISEGNPGGDDAERRARMHALAPAFRVVDAWAYHAYWLPSGPDLWHTYRYRLNVAYLAELGIPPLPLFISEGGIDGAIMGQPGKGWISLSNLPTFWPQCLAVEGELLKDAYVRCLTLFTASPNPDWVDFNTDGELSALMTAHVRDGAPVQPPTPPTPPAPQPADVALLIRGCAWSNLYLGEIGYNPTYAFPRYAGQADLGCPVTKDLRLDVDGVIYALQGFAKAIAYCPEGQWDEIRELSWS